MPRFYLLIWIAFLSLAQPFTALAQTNVPAPLPPAAQEAVDKGVIAAKVSEYLLAIRYFEDARKLAPTSPVIYLNLGLAESRIPGRELRAIAWFGAYLASYSGAPNAAAVNEQIAVLEIKNQGSLARLIRITEDAAKQHWPTNKWGHESAWLRDEALQKVAVLWAKNGDFEIALRTLDGTSSRELIKDETRVAIAYQQITSGDFAGAKKTAGLIQNANTILNKSQTLLRYVAEAQAKAGDIAGAQMTAESVAEGSNKDLARYSITTAQLQAGDIAGAQKTGDNFQDAGGKDWALSVISQAQAEAGDIVGAQKTADRIHDAASRERAGRNIPFAQTTIASAAEKQAEAGDIVGAQKTADRIQGAAGGWKDRVLGGIAVAKAKSGDITGAQKTADSLPPGWKDKAQAGIAAAQAQAGDIAGAQKTVDSIQAADWKSVAQKAITALPAQPAAPSPSVNKWIVKNGELLNEAVFLDLGSYLKSLPSDNTEKLFDGLHNVAKKIADARQVITQMLKQQAKR